METSLMLRRSAAYTIIFAALTVIVQARFAANLDQAAMAFVVSHRPPAAVLFDWFYRLGFIQVDLPIALLWFAVLLFRHRSLRMALPPLLLVTAIGLQAGARLLIDQPAPKTFEIARPQTALAAAGVLDRADMDARRSFVAAVSGAGVSGATVAPPQTPTAAAPPPSVERGSYPSGHSSRTMFLALLALPFGAWPRRRVIRHACIALVLAAPLAVGYSTLYFGYHWPSDVLGGYLLALAVLPVAHWLSAPRLL